MEDIYQELGGKVRQKMRAEMRRHRAGEDEVLAQGRLAMLGVDGRRPLYKSEWRSLPSTTQIGPGSVILKAIGSRGLSAGPYSMKGSPGQPQRGHGVRPEQGSSQIRAGEHKYSLE